MQTQMPIQTGDPPVPKSFAPLEELRNCYSPCCWWKFSLRSRMSSRIRPPHIIQRPQWLEVLLRWHGVSQKRHGHKERLRLHSLLRRLRRGILRPKCVWLVISGFKMFQDVSICFKTRGLSDWPNWHSLRSDVVASFWCNLDHCDGGGGHTTTAPFSIQTRICIRCHRYICMCVSIYTYIYITIDYSYIIIVWYNMYIYI